MSQSCGSITRADSVEHVRVDARRSARQLGDRERGHRQRTASSAPTTAGAERLEHQPGGLVGRRRVVPQLAPAAAARPAVVERPPGRAAARRPRCRRPRCRDPGSMSAEARTAAPPTTPPGPARSPVVSVGGCAPRPVRDDARRCRRRAALDLGRLRRRVDPAHQRAHWCTLRRWDAFTAGPVHQ